MTSVIASFKVTDYDRWRAGYARAAKDPGVRSWKVWRAQDVPNHVVIMETFDSRDDAEGVFGSETTRQAMEADGVDLGTLHVMYFDEVD